MTAERYKVWYIPQIPGKAFEREVDSLPTAVLLINAIIDFSIFEFENRVKPDYSDAAGISRWEEDGEGGHDWFDVEEEEWNVG